MNQTIPSPSKMERNGKLRILTFEGGPIRDIENRLARDLEGQTDSLADCHLLLDFTRVESVGSAELGTIVSLHKKVSAGGGRLTLFNLKPEVFEAFEITRLNTLIQICREQDDYLLDNRPSPER